MSSLIAQVAPAATLAVDPNKKVVMDAVDAINKGDVNSFTALLDAPLHSGFTTAFQQARAGFANMHLTIDDIISEGGKVVTRWTMTGTHSGDAAFGRLGVVKATHMPITVSGITIHQIQAGKVVESWGVTEELRGLSQLGLVENYAKAVAVPLR